MRCVHNGSSRSGFPEYLHPWARKIIRLQQLIRSLGLALGGRGTETLAPLLGVTVSGTAALRLLIGWPEPPESPSPPVRVLGVDDFAFRRGRAYGTILMDLEHRCVIDLLPDRLQLSFALWLRCHPEVRFMSRDRGGDYVAAATLAAPQEEQIADRCHLLVSESSASSVTRISSGGAFVATRSLTIQSERSHLYVQVHRDVWGRDRDRAVEWSPLFERRDERLALLRGDPAQREGQVHRVEEVYVWPHGMRWVVDALDLDARSA
jgi:hypothetical protein